MLRYHRQGASALALAVAFMSLNVPPGKAKERPVKARPVQELPTVEVSATNEKPDGPGTSQAGAGLGGRFTGYNVTGPAAASKTDIPILQTPFNIQVVPREAIDNQQAVSVTDAVVSNVSGVQAGADTLSLQFIIRGFSTFNVFRNELRQQFPNYLETANLQSIEVLKGVAAMLFGRSEPGGIVNLVVKRPLLVPYYSIQEQAGSFGRTRTTVDATGPLTDDKTWLYRINLVYNHNNSFRNFVTNQNAFVGPTITYHPIEQFRFNLDAQYQNAIFNMDSFATIPALGTRPAPIPISRYLMEPALTVVNPSREEVKFIGYDWTFDINPDWHVTNRFAFIDSRQAQRQNFFGSLCVTPGTPSCIFKGAPLAFGDLTRRFWDINRDRSYVTANLDLKGKFATGPFNHAVLIGSDYFIDHTIVAGVREATPNLFAPINIFTPAYLLSGYVKPAFNFFNPSTQGWRGVYAQDYISFADDRLHLLFGGRYDWAEFGQGSSTTSLADANGPFNPATRTGFQTAFNKAFSPRAGAVVQPLPWLSFYGNYSQGFGPTTGTPAPGQPPHPPQIGTQYEGGVKAEFFDGRLTATMAFYDITKTNILASVPGTAFTVPIGLVQSKGAEFDIAGRINENWSLIGNYSHTDARILKDSAGTGGPGNTGNRLASVPLDSGNLWVKYDADGAFRGLSLGAGLNVVGERPGDNANTFQLPAYTLVNGMILYQFQPAALPWVKNLTAQLNVRNLFGATFYQASRDRFDITPGAPRTFLASLRAEF